MAGDELKKTLIIQRHFVSEAMTFCICVAISVAMVYDLHQHSIEHMD